jgi:hypothetical protein
LGYFQDVPPGQGQHASRVTFFPRPVALSPQVFPLDFASAVLEIHSVESVETATRVQIINDVKANKK